MKELYVNGRFIHIRDTKEHSSVLINIKHIESIRTRENGMITIITARGEVYEIPWSKYYEKVLINCLETMKDSVEIHTEGADPLAVVRVMSNGDYYEEA